MKFYFERSSQAALFLGFVLIIGLISYLYWAFDDEHEHQEARRHELALQLEKTTLLTNIFEAMNQLNITLESAVLIENQNQLIPVFNRADMLRASIADNRKNLQNLLTRPSDLEFITEHGNITLSGLASQKYYESLLRDFKDRDEALEVFTKEVAPIQEASLKVLSNYYIELKAEVSRLLTELSEKNKRRTQAFQRTMLVTFMLIWFIAIMVLYIEMRHTQAISRQKNLLRKQNDTLERTVLKRTAKLKEASQEAIAANKAKSDFLAVMSHEIRTPMNGVLGTLNLLDEQQLSEENRELIRTAKQSSELLMTVINDVLDYSKIEAGKFELYEQPFHVISLVDSFKSMFKPLAEAKGLKFRVDTQQLAELNLIGDAIRISQIINNYLNNALKFTEKGEIVLWLGSDKDGRFWAQVSDTGIGINPKNLKKLFKDFTQVNMEASRKFQGTGLGLAICRKLAELMDGSVEVTSEEGKGSTFGVFLPLKVAPSQTAEHGPHAHSNQGTPPEHEGRKILLVEDNAVNQMVARKILEKSGFSVDIAANGEECLALFNHHALDSNQESDEFALILMDCQMPVMDGFEATRRLRNQGLTLPVIALTANTQMTDKEACLKAGMDDFISKPFKPEELISMIDYYLT